MRKPTSYKATVHTLTIQLTLKPKWAGHEYEWWHDYVWEKKYGFITNKYTMVQSMYVKQPRMIVNPHKLHRTESGKWLFEYVNASEIERRLTEIDDLLDADGHVNRRVDICIDAKCKYGENEKIIRLIQLMLAEAYGYENRYASNDPLTLEAKTTVATRGAGDDKTVSTEHYNRNLFKQDEWENEPIVNRFELRLMGNGLRGKDTIADVAEYWIEKLEGLKKAHFDAVIDRLTQALYGQWEAYCKRGGQEVTSSMRNSFYSVKSEYIFTRAQLVGLYAMDGAEGAINNLLKSKRNGKWFELYSYRDVKREAEALVAALDEFISCKQN